MGFLSNFGVTVDRDRLRTMASEYRAGLPTKDQVIAAGEELLEVGGAAFAMGALEQRYGETKTTLFMKDQTDAAGNPLKDDKGNTLKKSGTGIPMSAVGAVGGVAIAAFVPMTPSWRRRTLNIATGLGAAWGYRKGIEVGQKWLDSANKVPEGSETTAPKPPFEHSTQTIAGEMGESNVVSLIQEAQNIIDQNKRRAAGAR